MSKVSSKTRYETFQEWHKWASSRYASMKKKKRANPEFFGSEFKIEE